MAYKDKELEGYGGATEIPAWDPEHVLCVADEGHPLYTPTRAYRYQLDDEQSIADMASIDKEGVHTPVKACVRSIGGKKLHVIILGSRRTVMLRAVNKRRVERGDKPYKLQMTIDNRITDAEWMSMYISENENRKGNDPMTQIETASDLLRKNVSEEDVMRAFPLVFRTPGELRRTVQEGGLLEAHPSVKQAVARIDLLLPDALTLVKNFPEQEAQEGVIGAYLACNEIENQKERDAAKKRVLRGEDADKVPAAPRKRLNLLYAAQRETLLKLVESHLSRLSEPGTIAEYKLLRESLKELTVKKDKAL